MSSVRCTCSACSARTRPCTTRRTAAAGSLFTCCASTPRLPPCALHSAPSTLHPALCTLHPPPSTLTRAGWRAPQGSRASPPASLTSPTAAPQQSHSRVTAECHSGVSVAEWLIAQGQRQALLARAARWRYTEPGGGGGKRGGSGEGGGAGCAEHTRSRPLLPSAHTSPAGACPPHRALSMPVPCLCPEQAQSRTWRHSSSSRRSQA